jgi:hypothetical protein
MSDLPVVSDAEVVEPDEVTYPRLADASRLDMVAWPLGEARFRLAQFINEYPGYAEEGARALGYIDLAESIIKNAPHRTYGDYGHTA